MMRHLTEEEEKIMKRMDEIDENSDEYKRLQKELIEIGKKEDGNTPFCH